MSTRIRPLVTRPNRTVAAAVLGVLLVVAGGLTAWLVGTMIATGSWPPEAAGVMRSTGALRVGDAAIAVLAGVLALLGIAALVAALRPGRRARSLILPGQVPGQTAISRRDLGRHVRRGLEQVDGVHSAVVAVRPRRVDVVVHSPVDHVEPVLAAAQSAVDRAMAELRPITALPTRVRAQRTH